MHIRIENITGLMLLILVNKNIPICLEAAPNPSCGTRKETAFTCIDCSKRKDILGVPSGLKSDIECLDISDNPQGVYTDKSFDEYPNLKKLIMKNQGYVAGVSSVGGKTFAKMPKLEYLDASNSLYYHVRDRNLTFPSTLKVLKLDSCSIAVLDLSNCEVLEELYANYMALYTFPSLHPEAPIRVIEVKRNPLHGFNVSQIVPYCQLKRLALEYQYGLDLHDPLFSCVCRRLKNWIVESQIRSSPLNCSNPYSSAPPCQEALTTKEKEPFRYCLTRLLHRKTRTQMYIFVGVILLLMLLLLLLAYLAYEKRKALLEKMHVARPNLLPNDEQEETEEELEDEEDVKKPSKK